MQILRPYAMVIEGELVRGLEAIRVGAEIVELRPHTRPPGDYLLTPAFVNAHSHLEYRGMMGKIPLGDYFPWINQLTQMKMEESEGEVMASIQLAVKENRSTGVALIGEHTDRLGSAQAMREHGMTGHLFQELITFFEAQNPTEKWRSVEEKAEQNRHFGSPVTLSPHAFQTVDRESLRKLGASGFPISIHVAETAHENALSLRGEGVMAEFRQRFGLEVPQTGKSVVASLHDLGVLRKGTQCVHVCALEPGDLDLLASSRVTIAHCPRSNKNLGCPPARVRRFLDAGITVGLGMDSAASSGPIDMFEEMRSALHTSYELGEPVTPEEVWQMATSWGAASFGEDLAKPWGIYEGSRTPLVRLHLPLMHNIEQVIEEANPSHVDWV